MFFLKSIFADNDIAEKDEISKQEIIKSVLDGEPAEAVIFHADGDLKLQKESEIIYKDTKYKVLKGNWSDGVTTSYEEDPTTEKGVIKTLFSWGLKK